MNRLFALKNGQGRFFVCRVLIDACALSLCASVAVLAQSTTSPLKENTPFSIRATHLLGFPNIKSNCKGTLSAQDNRLRFQQSGEPIAQVEIASVRNIFLGEERMQVGGVPLKIGEAAAPYGGGRLISLFAHKKYDTVTLEYIDGDGGVHGVIFQLAKGEGELVRKELVARGVSYSSGEEEHNDTNRVGETHEHN